MAQYEQERHVQKANRELQARQAVLTQKIPGDPNHEQIARTAVEDQLGGNPGIGATENGRQGRMVLHRRRARGGIVPQLPVTA